MTVRGVVKVVKADFEIYFRGEDFDETLIIKKNIWVAIKTITNGEKYISRW